MKIMNLATNRMRSTALALCAFAIGATPMWSQAPQNSSQDAPPPPPQNDGGGGPPHRGGWEHMQEHRIEMLTRRLSLTPDQVAQVKAIDKDGQTQMMALREDTSIAPPDKHAKMKAIHDAQTSKIRALLTDEQKPKFDAMVAHEQEHRRGGEGPQGGPMNPPPPPPA